MIKNLCITILILSSTAEAMEKNVQSRETKERSKDLDTKFFDAVYEENVEEVKRLLGAGANVYAVDHLGNIALSYIPWHMRRTTRELLLQTMLSIPDDVQKKRLYTFMCCLKRLYPVQYPNLRKILKSALDSIIIEENEGNPESRVNKAWREIKWSCP